MLVQRGREHVVAGGVERESGHRPVVDAEVLDGLRGRHVPHPDGGVVRGGDDGVLRARVVHNAIDLLRVTLEDGHDLEMTKK